MCSRCDATASATVRSSVLMRSTISSGDARSIAAVRGFRCSVMRGSRMVNLGSRLSVLGPRRSTAGPMCAPRANLPGVTRQSQPEDGLAVPRVNPFVRRALLVAVLVVPPAADAQVFEVRRPSAQPQFWGSLSAGLFQSQSVIDGTTESEWRLNDAAQFRGSL